MLLHHRATIPDMEKTRSIGSGFSIYRQTYYLKFIPMA